MKLKSRIFESAAKSWDEMCEEVSEFASTVGKDRLVNVSVASAGGLDLGGVGSRGTIIVWYWE
jgi:hypothetical protein